VIAAVAVLALCGCSGGGTKKDAPAPGPLELTTVQSSCIATHGAGEVELDAGPARNPADIPLTIDLVSLTGAENVALLDAFLLPGDNGAEAVPAVDATVPKKGEAGDNPSLHLRLRLSQAGADARITGFSVDYHNVHGKFRATSKGSLALLRRCRP